MEVKNAKITSTTLGNEDHGIFSYCLMLDYGGSGQGAGMICLDTPDKTEEGKKKFRRIGTAFGMQHIMDILRVVGVSRWEDLPGKYIRVRATHGGVDAIGNALRDDWLDTSGKGEVE